ncbi:exopolyphosphatase [Parabacteroides sp. An277]|uniref:Ppx/GppA phosphatase family protein n=1 Tax=Parabacteroides sp. An277 TaxID=1965619 RepID=UPI000B383EC1|nr:exopolyphosphatase [Parabacteroides sp. An277]OUO55516.1 exopolyphosphatase [Parabacteroides sp. An277]
MKSKTYAAIDIGSNAVRLLIKKVTRIESTGEDKFSKVLLLRIPLRLGFDVFEKGEISPVKEERMRRLMKAYRHLMKIYEVDSFRACATSAMRDAKNGKSIIKKIAKSTGIQIEIIDGQEEAQMIYNNHIECMEDRNGNYMYVDVGGGSTEVNLLVNGELVYSRSFNIGTVRILTDGVTEAAWQQMRDEIAAHTKDYPVINIIGSGGNINKLYKLIDKKDKRRKRIPISSLQSIYDKLKILTPEARMDAFNLKPDRADVIVPASEIFLCIAEVIHAEYIYVPEIGLSDGIIDDLFAADQKAEREV